MGAKVGRWVCLICMATNWGLIPVHLYLHRPDMALISAALGAMCGSVAWVWGQLAA